MRESAPVSSPRRGVVSSVRGVFYGWWLAAIASFMITIMSLTVFLGTGTLLVALQREFGWSRTALSGAFALARVEGAVLGPIEGVLVDRVGTRRMTLIGYLVMAVGFVMQSQINSLWQFYVAFIVISLGSGLGGWLAMIAMVNNWFNRKRSMAMATAMSGTHFAGFLVPLFAYCMEVFGFRDVSMGIGILMLVIIGPVTKAIRNYPEQYGMRPDGDPPEGEGDGSDREAYAAAAVRVGVHGASGVADLGVLAAHHRAGGLQRRDSIAVASPLAQVDRHGDDTDPGGGRDRHDNCDRAAVPVRVGLLWPTACPSRRSSRFCCSCSPARFCFWR